MAIVWNHNRKGNLSRAKVGHLEVEIRHGGDRAFWVSLSAITTTKWQTRRPMGSVRKKTEEEAIAVGEAMLTSLITVAYEKLMEKQ